MKGRDSPSEPPESGGRVVACGAQVKLGRETDSEHLSGLCASCLKEPQAPPASPVPSRTASQLLLGGVLC